ncbi:glycosyltransferase [Arthrobacter sp. HY1533]|uniref:glycosyltransferase n=1 Tax=Arthrobacter sp. HY1533 TaxID=2970919 RepID=UPI0022BA050E|nr:glycosyltransferase [Arthrobacter sp. HY1533]
MKIVHVVTLISPEGAYGGPVRVALNQLGELQKQGHEVLLVASYRGYLPSQVPKFIDGVPVSLFPAVTFSRKLGFAGTISPRMILALPKIFRNFDVIHMHFARDLVVLPAGIFATLNRKKSVFIQTHGMIDESNSQLAHIIDWLMTKRVMKRSRRVFYLTDVECASLLHLFPFIGCKIHYLPNAVPTAAIVSPEESDVVEFIFLARLQSRKNPDVFVHAAKLRIENGSKARYTVVGPDEGMGKMVDDLIREAATSMISREAAVAMTAASLRIGRADVYVLPSVNEPFPMSVLEALAVGVPVLITESNGLADFVRQANSGIIVEPTADSVAKAMKIMEDDAALRSLYGSNATKLAQDEFSMSKVGSQLIANYGQ